MKYLSPYQTMVDGTNEYYVRFSPKGEWYTTHINGALQTMEECKKAADEWLLSNGYVFLTEEQWEKWDKYQLLM